MTASGKTANEYIMYVGAYTNAGASKGIHAVKFQPATGELQDLGLAAETVNPSFLAIHQNGRYLYAVSEVASHNGERTGAVSAFAIERPGGKLRFLNQVESKGAGPCYVTVDATGKNVLVANYGDGSVAVLPVNPDGSLKQATAAIQHKGSSVDPKRQQGPHAHSINLSADNRFAVAADLGLDQLLVYRFDPQKGSLEPNNPPFAKLNPGAGPRHFVFHPKGRRAYAINEMQSTVTAFQYEPKKGAFTEIHTISTLPQDFKGANNSTAEIRIHPSGKFLYGSNRGHDSIAIFRVDGGGRLTPAGHVPTQGRTPRNFNIDPTGRYLFAANQNSNSIVVFRIDQKTGALAPTGKTLQVGAPVCIRFTPAQ